MILWDEVYCRFTPHDKDRHSASVFTQTQTQSSNVSLNQAHSPSQTVVGRGQAFSVSMGAVAGMGATNRYHPRSPRMGGSVLMKAPAMSLDDDGDDEQKSKRTKPPPPMRVTREQGSDSAQKVALAVSETSDCAEEKQSTSGMGGLTSIQVGDVVEADDEDEYGHDHFGDDYDSDSASIPEKVKRIAMLQQKVSQLESILQEYRKKETRGGFGRVDDDDEEEVDAYRLEARNTKG